MNLQHNLNLVVTKDYHKLWVAISLKSVEIHVLGEEVVLVLCGQVACMLYKNLIKRYAISFIFTQYVLCENASLVSAMILFESSKMVFRFLDNK